MTVEQASLIVLNNDTVVCEDCYDELRDEANVDYGLWPMARTTDGECSTCGGACS